MRARHTRKSSSLPAAPPARPLRSAMAARRPTSAMVLLATVTTVLLAACSPAGDPVASGPPPTSPTTTQPTPTAPVPGGTPTTTAPTPSPTATWPPRIALPTPPPEMARDDEAGAVAAATYFITELYPYTYVSQDTSPLKAVSHEKCQFCSTVLSAVASERSARRATHPGAMTVRATSPEAMSPLEYQITIDIDQTANTLWSADGALIGSNEPHQTKLAVFVLWREDRWVLRGVDALVIDGVAQ